MKELRIKYLRIELAKIARLIASTHDYTGELTNKAESLLAELDQLTQ